MGLTRPDTVALNWLLTLPFFAALCAELFPRLSLSIHSEQEAESLRRGPFFLGALASLMGLVLALSLVPAVSRGAAISADYWWTDNLYQLRLRADVLVAPVLALLYGLGLLIHLHLAGMPSVSHPHHRAALLLAAQGCALCTCASADLVLMLFLLELTAVCLWLLAALDSLPAANELLAMSYVGGIVVLAGALVMWAQAGDSSLLAAPLLLVAAEPGPVQTTALLVLLGLLPTLACVPAHGWLPGIARRAPILAPAPGLLLPVLGGLVLVRLLPGCLMLAVTPALGLVALVLGVAALWWGAMRAYVAPTLRELAVWLTVAQGGYLLIAVGAAAAPTAPPELTRASALHVLCSPVALAALWLAAGAARTSFATDSIADLSGLATRAPALSLGLLLGGLSLAGLPGLPGFQAQRLLISGLVREGRIWFAAVLVGADLLIALAVVDALRRVGPRRPPLSTARWSSPWLSGSVLLAAVTLILGGLMSDRLLSWTELALRGALSISRGALSLTP